MATRKHKVLPYGIEIISGGIGSELSSLFRRILKDNGVDAERYNDLMYWYIAREQSKTNRNERMEARIGLSQELMKEVMTWKTFVKGLKFLHVDLFEIDVVLSFEHRRAMRLVLKSKLSEYGHPGEILAALFNLLQAQMKESPTEYEQRLTAYVEKTRGQQSKKDKAAARASLSKELQKTTMSWRTFVKGLVFDDVLKYGFNITLFRRMKPPTTHGVTVNLDDYKETTDDEGED